MADHSRKLNKFPAYILTVATISLVIWTDYKWGWLKDRHWIFVAALLLSFFAGLLLRKNTRYGSLAWGLIYGSLTFFIIMIVRIIWILILASGM